MRGSDLPTVKSRLVAELKTECGCDSADTVSPFLTSLLGKPEKEERQLKPLPSCPSQQDPSAGP